MSKRLYGIAILLASVSAAQLAIASALERPLRNERVVIERLYAGVSELPWNERPAFVRALSPEAQEDLWTLHLERTLAAHPELTLTERAIVMEVIEYLEAGVIETVARGGSEAQDALAGLAATTELIKAALPPAVAREMFRSVGGAPPKTNGKEDPISTDGIDSCTCNLTYDLCSLPFEPGPRCSAVPRCRPTSSGCGILWLSGCGGTCQ